MTAFAKRSAGENSEHGSGSFVVVDGIVKHFPVRTASWRRSRLRALDGVSLTIDQGEILGLVGESGCGKSTLARILLRLLAPDSGCVTVAGHNLALLHGERLRRFRRSIQLIFQNPFAALDPRMRIGSSLEQPLAQHGIATREQRRARTIEMLEEVGLDRSFVDRFPSQCSGGQLQRIVIARALLLNPRFLVCDEPTSALDAPLRAQIINLLVRLKSRYDLTLLVISHDLRTVRYISDRVAVMYLGKIVEIAEREALFNNPLHPYTRALIAASLLEENNLAAADGAHGEPPSPVNPPNGCHFHPRCGIAQSRCTEDAPELCKAIGEHQAACFFWDKSSALSFPK